MASKKPVETGTALQPWEKRMAEAAEQAAESASSTGGTSKKIGTRGGIFTIDGAEVDGDAIEVIVLDFAIDVTYYEDDFDPDDIIPPTASALGRNEKELVWAEGSHPDFAGKELKDSEVFQWGSADKGKGKAAKSRRRLLLISAGDIDEGTSAEIRKLIVPVTSGSDWDAYVKTVKSAHGRPPCGVVTEVTIKKHPKYQFTLSFKMVGVVEDDSMSEMLDMRDSVEEELFTPYAPYDQEREEEDTKKTSKAVAKSAPARAKPKARR